MAIFGDNSEMPIFPPKEKKTAQISARMPGSLSEDLDKIAAATGYSKNEVIVRLLQIGLAEFQKEQKKKK